MRKGKGEEKKSQVQNFGSKCLILGRIYYIIEELADTLRRPQRLWAGPSGRAEKENEMPEKKPENKNQKNKRPDKTEKRFSVSKTQKKLSLIFGLFILVIIPVYSVLLMSKADIFSVSLSAIAYEHGYYSEFFLWATLVSIFYLVFLGYLFSIAKFENKKAIIIYVVGCVLVFLTVVFPYLPEVFPILTELHNLIGMGSAVLLMISVFFFVFFLADKDKKVYTMSMVALISIVTVCAVIYFFLGMNSLIEVIFVVATGVFLFFLSLWIRRTPVIDADENYKASLVARLRKKQAYLQKKEEEIQKKIEEILTEQKESAPGESAEPEALPSEQDRLSEVSDQEAETADRSEDPASFAGEIGAAAEEEAPEAGEEDGPGRQEKEG